MSGEIVLVTGAASGIGRAAAVAFAEAGAKAVVVADVDDAGGAETVTRVRSAGATAEFVHTDVSKKADVDALVALTLQHYGRLDIAVNNAGIVGKSAALTDQTEADFDRVIGVNAKGVFFGMHAELPPMIAQGSGSIVNVASIAGQVAFPMIAPYVASKHAVIGLTKTAALEVARQGVRVNVVAPGIIDTPMTAGDEATRAAMREMEPVGRFGTAEEIANAIVFLGSPRSCFITGETLTADGGYVAR